MKNLFLLLFVFFSINLYGQEFDGVYNVNVLSIESDGAAPLATMLRWAAVVKGDTVTLYDSRKMTNSIDTVILGTSSQGDLRIRTTMNKIDDKGGYTLNATKVDDFTKKVTTAMYVMKKQ